MDKKKPSFTPHLTVGQFPSENGESLTKKNIQIETFDGDDGLKPKLESIFDFALLYRNEQILEFSIPCFDFVHNSLTGEQCERLITDVQVTHTGQVEITLWALQKTEDLPESLELTVIFIESNEKFSIPITIIPLTENSLPTALQQIAISEGSF